MRVLVAGATGAIGARLVPQLLRRGHEVIGTSRSNQKLPACAPRARRRSCSIYSTATPCARRSSRPAPTRSSTRRRRSPGCATSSTSTAVSRPRTGCGRRGRTLCSLPRARPAWSASSPRASPGPYARTGGLVKAEEDPLDPTPVPAMSESLAALRHLERVVTAAGGIVLRYGGLYGSPDDAQLELVRKRRFPIVGDGDGIWSFVHLDDAAAATVLALERGAPGVYNIVDDDPAPVREWLPALAEAIGAKPPRRVPRWPARLAAGEAGVALMTEIRSASNEKAKRELGWTLRFSSWRQGFAAAYGD